MKSINTEQSGLEPRLLKCSGLVSFRGELRGNAYVALGNEGHDNLLTVIPDVYVLIMGREKCQL